MHLNQTDFGAIGGVGRRTQAAYESGERAPDSDVLTAWADQGADVLYILTGQRTEPAEKDPLLAAINILSSAEKATFEALLLSFARLVARQP